MTEPSIYLVNYQRKDLMSPTEPLQDVHFDIAAIGIDHASLKAQRELFRVGMEPPANYDVWNATVIKSNSGEKREILKEGGWLIDDDGKPLPLEKRAS